MMLELAQRNRMSIEGINRNAEQRGGAMARLAFDGAIDHTRWFTCMTLAPLAHSPVFATLNEAQQRRYNQLAGLLQNEVISFFEQEIGGGVLPALLRHAEPELAAALKTFHEEERLHTQMFRRLNQLAAPEWYATSDYYLLRLPQLARWALRQLAARPRLFPLTLWVMLLMEERSLMMSKRYAALDPALVDANFLAVYRAHAEDEVRHVHLDWHLLERFYLQLPRWWQRLNVRLLEALLEALLFKPKRVNVRLVELLIDEFPDLQARRAELLRAVVELADQPGYRQMMYSLEAAPITGALFVALPEFARLRRRLFFAEAA